jgi:hypothetical protein
MKKVLLVLVVVLGGLAAFITTRPGAYHVERSIDIDTTPAVIFPVVSDLKAMGEWSPWDKRDPAMTKTFSEATTGVGATYSWAGNKDVGKGKMTITELRAPEHVADRLEFIEPMTGEATTAMDLKAGAGGGTRVTWSMDGNSNFVGKAISLVMSMDKMIGKDFDAGLVNLKKVAEARAVAAAEAEAQAKAAAAKAAAEATKTAEAEKAAAPAAGAKPKKH